MLDNVIINSNKLHSLKNVTKSIAAMAYFRISHGC